MNTPPATFRIGYLQHAAMAQFHRWYQYYEQAQPVLANQLDILSPQVRVKSGLGEVRGHAAYSERVAQLPKDWKNAHFLKDARVDVDADGAMRLTAQITYLNQGMLPDGAVRSAELTYATQLRPVAGSVLPKFESIEIMQHSEGRTEQFRAAYADNRLLSLVHYWLALIEDPSRNPAPARDILATPFRLNFSTGAITDFATFEAWLAGPGSQVSASTHQISNFSCASLGGDRYSLSADFEWEGLRPDGTAMVAKTRHHWTVLDNPAERFARIQTVDVQVLQPSAATPSPKPAPKPMS